MTLSSAAHVRTEHNVGHEPFYRRRAGGSGSKLITNNRNTAVTRK